MSVKLQFEEIALFRESVRWLTHEFEFIAAAMAQSDKKKQKKLYVAIARCDAMAEKLSGVEITVNS